MDEVLIKAVQKIACTRSGKAYGYEAVKQICEAFLSLSTLIERRETEKEKGE